MKTSVDHTEILKGGIGVGTEQKHDYLNDLRVSINSDHFREINVPSESPQN